MSERITIVPALPDGRPETGPMQFGDDWPGVFIRGDNALFDARAVDAALLFVPEDRWDIRAMLRGLRDTLASCSVGDTGWPPGPAIPQAERAETPQHPGASSQSAESAGAENGGSE